MLLVVDTNIIVNAIKTNNENSKSRMLMRDKMTGKHIMLRVQYLRIVIIFNDRRQTSEIQNRQAADNGSYRIYKRMGGVEQ